MLLPDATTVLMGDRRVALGRALTSGRPPVRRPRLQLMLGHALVRTGARLLREAPVPAGMGRR